MIKLFILSALILLVFIARFLKQDIFSPAVINIYWNAFFIIGGVIFFGNGIDWGYNGILWMILTCFSCLIGQVVGGKFQITEISYKKEEKRNYLYVILVFIILIGLIEPLFYVKGFGYSVLDLVDFNKLLQLNTEIAYDRYSGHEYNAPAISAVLSIIIYMGALVGGYAFHYMKKVGGKILSVAVLLPIFFLAIITNAKVGVIASIFLWFIGWLLKSLQMKNLDRALTSRLLIIGVCVAILGIAFLDLTMLMRIGSIDLETQLIVNKKLQEYAFGQVNSFDYWYDSYDSTNLEMGANTYMFLTNWFGITARKQGVYDLMPGLVSNIYTINRGIITDFGKLGGIIYWFIIGGISGITYKRVKTGTERKIISMVILGAIYFTILYGFIISPWIYSSYVLAFIGFGVFLVVLKYVNINFKR